MNESFVNLAQQVFTRAKSPGPTILPAGLQPESARLSNDKQLTSESLYALGQSLTAQFPFLRNRSLVHDQFDEGVCAEWEAAVRAVLMRLRAWSSTHSYASKELSVLLYALDALGLDSVDVESVTEGLRGADLADGLYRLICDTEVTSFSPGHDRIPNADHDIKEAAQEGNFARIRYIAGYIMPAPNAVMWSAVRLLWKSNPANLAEAITLKCSVYFTLLVKLTLKNDFAALSVEVPHIWVKYLAVETLEKEHQRGNSSLNSAAILHKLLLQAADTPAWQGWMIDLLVSVSGDSLMSIALPGALAVLQTSHWVDFIDAMKLGYSNRSAGPISDIMMSFSQKVDARAASTMWSLCFNRWREWDYGINENQFHMFSPAVCAVDYPVARYYAEMPSHEREAEEAALSLAVEHVEEQWFASASDLITERNRLLSRLRLVAHGRRLATGGSNLLPPDIQPTDAYTSVRYSYYDVQARI